MLIDGRTISNGETLTADICIVGAGAAGLTLAQAFDAAPLTVLVLESGGVRPDPAIQSLADGTSTAPPYPFMESRARCVGGTTTRWSGACIPLDEGDFEAKPWLPYSGWPFTRKELWPYYQQARRIFGLPEQVPPLPTAACFHKPPLETKAVQFSTPLNLGRKFKRQIERSRNVTLVTYANVTHLLPESDGQRVVQLVIQNPAGHGFLVNPKTVILAAGGIENARLLLASNHIFPQGLGNRYDLVGRFFMEHTYQVVGILPLHRQYRDAVIFTNFHRFEQTQTQGTLGLTDELRHQQQLLNLHLRFYRYNLLEDSPAVIAAKQFQVAALHQRDVKVAAKHWRSLGTDAWSTLPRYISWHVWNKASRSAGFDHARLQGWIEQEPDPDNRVTLSRQRDCLGQPQAHLALRFSDRMADSVERSLQFMGALLAERGLGQLQCDRDRLHHLTAYDKLGLHHMGTTRMHTSPRQGVVDANCKVHELTNVYIAGSSVFPTGGAANPTFTIAALALRLADHIRHLEIKQPYS